MLYISAHFDISHAKTVNLELYLIVAYRPIDLYIDELV